MSEWDVVVKLRVHDYDNPSNVVVDLRNWFQDSKYVNNIKLVCAEKLKRNSNDEIVKNYYDYSEE